METVRAIGAVLSIGAILALSHWVISVFFFPRRLSARMNDEKGDWSAYGYLGLVLCSWFWFAYSGFSGLLFWLPSTWGSVDEDGSFTSARILGSVLLTFGSLCILGLMEGYARMSIEVSALRARLKGANRLIDRAYDIPGVLKEFEEASDESRPPMSPEDKLMLARLADRLADNIKWIVEQALVVEKRRRDEFEATSKQRAEDEAKRVRDEENCLQRERQIAAISSALPQPCDKVLTDVAALSAEFGVVEVARLKSCWDELSAQIGPVLRIHEPRQTHSRVVDLTQVLSQLRGLQLDPHATVSALYTGDTHGGSTAFTAAINGGLAPFFSALRFDETLNGLMAAFYFTHILPTLGRFWHRYRDYDYSFFSTKPALVDWLINSGAADLSAVRLKSLASPCGLRAWRKNDTIVLAMLGGGLSTGVEDFSVQVVQGRVTGADRQKVFDSGARIYY